MHVNHPRNALLHRVPNPLRLPRPVHVASFLDAAEVDSPHIPPPRRFARGTVRKRVGVREGQLHRPRRPPSVGVVQRPAHQLGRGPLRINLVIPLLPRLGDPPRVFPSPVAVGLVDHEIPDRIDRVQLELLVAGAGSRRIEEHLEVGIFLEDGTVPVREFRRHRKVALDQRAYVQKVFVPHHLHPRPLPSRGALRRGSIVGPADVIEGERPRD
mmetsp:Transcript_11639/g.34209  ORF Transcript_11639/g.34209 Transcript_11639/m.34209 type:complete len:213 (-) Transcript_11639:245-883(-)